MAGWSVVVPVKRLRTAKTRLVPPEGVARDRLALAMALDTVAAALACPAVAEVVAVSDDDVAVPQLRALGVVVVADEPDAGLNPALAHGAEQARARRPGCDVATLSSDLPSLRPRELADALHAAGAHRSAVVGDAAGTGTTLLTARGGTLLRPKFGSGSLERHRAAGAVELPLPEAPGLHRDVDTAEDLLAARALGLGPRTSALLGG